MAKIGVIIAVVVVLIVIVSGSLVLSGIVKLPSASLNSGTMSVTGTPATNSNVQQKAPNVVSSTQVNQSLGGGWNQKAGASGSSSNLSTAASITSFGLVNPGSNPYEGTLITGINGMRSTHFTAFTPVTMSAQHLNPNMTVQQFEANLYEPSGNGFAALGYLQLQSSNNVTQVYQYINYSAHASYNYSSGTSSRIFLTNGKDYLYQWAQAPFGDNNSLWNLSILIGTDGTNLIGIFYFTPDNLSTTHFTSLLNAEITKLSNPSTNPINNVFLTTSQIDNQTGLSFKQQFSALVGISNGLAMFNEYNHAYNIVPTYYTSDPTYNTLINDTISNLSLIGIASFSAGSYQKEYTRTYQYGSSTEYFAVDNQTVVGIANFSNAQVPSIIFSAFKLYEKSFLNATDQAKEGINVSSGNIGNNGQYFSINGPEYPIYNSTGARVLNIGNASLMFSVYNSFLVFILYTGHNAMGNTAMLNLLTEEYSYL